MRKITLTAAVVIAAVVATLGQGREGGGRQGGAAPAQPTIQQVKPGLYAILNPGANTLAVRVTNEGMIQYLSKLKVDDLGWALGPETLFVRNASGGFYDQLAKDEGRVGRYPAATGGDILITPVLHASVQVEYRDTVVHVDPWSAADLAPLKKASLILVTDDPNHHLDPKAITSLRRPGAPVVVTKKAQAGFAEGVPLANGQSTTLAGVGVQSIAAYDLTPGAPEHPKGEASGYLITLGGRRILFAGVTECVPELLALKDIDVAFMPMNIPPKRMTPAAAADCVKKLRPKVVYVQHYDNGAVAAITGAPAPAPGWLTMPTVADSLQAFRNALAGSGVEVRLPDWYAVPSK